MISRSTRKSQYLNRKRNSGSNILLGLVTQKKSHPRSKRIVKHKKVFHSNAGTELGSKRIVKKIRSADERKKSIRITKRIRNEYERPQSVKIIRNRRRDSDDVISPSMKNRTKRIYRTPERKIGKRIHHTVFKNLGSPMKKQRSIRKMIYSPHRTRLTKSVSHRCKSAIPARGKRISIRGAVNKHKRKSINKKRIVIKKHPKFLRRTSSKRIYRQVWRTKSSAWNPLNYDINIKIRPFCKDISNVTRSSVDYNILSL